MTKIYNNARVVKYHVTLSFVCNSKQDGYQKNDIQECDTAAEAIVKTLVNYLDEPYPLAGISVHELVFAA
jgi:hypothetical protein